MSPKEVFNPHWKEQIGELLQKNTGLRVVDDPEKLEYYRQDLNADLPPMIRDLMLKTKPDILFQPTTEKHIREILAFARAHQIPLTLRGAGTGGFGGAVPTSGGILMDLGLMNQVQVDVQARQLNAGPGARFVEIDRELARHGLTLLSMPSGKGGTLTGWIVTGGIGLGTFRHGPVAKQLLSIRVITPAGEVRELKADDPDLPYFVSTEGQMGVIVEATLRVGERPPAYFPFAIPFFDSKDAFSLAKDLAKQPNIAPDDVIIFHSELVRVLPIPSGDGGSSHPQNLVLVGFAQAEPADRFRRYLTQRGIEPAEEKVAQFLWEERSLPLSIKPLGPSLLAAEVVLPLDRVAAYQERVRDWGQRLGVTFYPISHLIDPERVLLLVMIPSDYRKAIFYIDLLLVPMMVRLAIQGYGGKPYGLGICNTPFLQDLFPPREVKRLVQFKKKVDPTGLLNPGKFFGVSGRFSSLQKVLFQSGVFNFELTAIQWLLFRLFTFLPEKVLRRRLPVVSRGMEEIANDILSCAQCGRCVARCPVYRATGDETFTARGKLLNVKRALRASKIELAKVLPLYFCLHCGRCDEECQVNLKHRPLFDRLEQVLAESIPFPLQAVAEFIRQVEESPDFQRFLDVVRTGFDQKIHEPRQTFPRYRVAIDEEHCLHCGTCVDACMYSVRKREEGDPRKVVVADENLCRGCGACLERCPQVAEGLAATTVELHPRYLQMEDPYWSGEVISRIDLEATTGKIPVSGTGQGDPHRGLGNDGIRFGHFHIVGPAQNLLYESSEDAIAVQLGKRPKYLTFRGDEIETPSPRLVKLKTPLLLEVMPVDGGHGMLAALLEAAGQLGTRLTLRLEEVKRMANRVRGKTGHILVRLSAQEAKVLLSAKTLPAKLKDHFFDWVEVEVDAEVIQRSHELRTLFPEGTIFSAVVWVTPGDVDAELHPQTRLRQTLDSLFPSIFDLLCLTSEFHPDKGYYPTTDAVPAVHRFLVEKKERHRFSILASGGIRSAADAQKTIQRGANGIKIDWPALFVADPMAWQKFRRKEPLSIPEDASLLVKRLVNLIRVWNVQIIEVLGASGFKDIKKTVGEENRLLIFDDLEERVYDIFHSPSRRERNHRTNRARMEREGPGRGWRYRQLKDRVQLADLPHRFYSLCLKDSCQKIFDRDYVWPASLLETVGRMASGDSQTLLLGCVEERGNLGDGFDDMRIRFSTDPDQVDEDSLEDISTSLHLADSLTLRTPLLGAGMSVGSIGPGTWRARVLATRALETQLDTGEGGYPTLYLMDSKWNPLDLTDSQTALLSRVLEERRLIPLSELLEQADRELATLPDYPPIRKALAKYPSSLEVQFVPIVAPEDETYISTELKTGLFGVTQETIRKAPRVVIAYSQGAKQGVGGHLLGRKVFGLVSRLRGVAEGTSLISPFPFHNCYSIEDVKAFIDAVRMINARTTICIKVSPSPDIEFIVSGLARIAKDNRMVIEVWLDGPRGGTGAAPDIIKGQMGMHMEYAIPICHEKLMDDGLRDFVVFTGSGGFRTWADIIKGVAMGLDGVILGTADLVAIGCVRDRNCESGCRSGISTLEPRMQRLRDIEMNTRQIINFRAILQAQVIRALGALGMKDIRELRGRYDCVTWPLLEGRVGERLRRRAQIQEAGQPMLSEGPPAAREILPGPLAAPSDCGVAAVVSNHFIPSHVMDLMLDRMANRGMDGVGIWKGGCYPDHLDHYALNLLIKGTLQPQAEQEIQAQYPGLLPRELQRRAREKILAERRRLMGEILEKYLKVLEIEAFDGNMEKYRISYRRDLEGEEQDFRSFGGKDPGDMFRFFVRVRPEEIHRFIVEALVNDPVWPPKEMRYREVTIGNYGQNRHFLQEAEDEYIYRLSRRITQENYAEVKEKRAAVMSCGKNSGCWKTDGRLIPWELPEAPVNVIHRRLATGSVVDQMNAHPFAELHTALTHNGETTNYRTMVNRLAQFNLVPLVQTDTAVASLKLHLLSQYLQYPFDALVEAFSPTTGWKLSQLPSEVRQRFERVQEVELESAPDGPYQYLCGRIDPYRRVIERLDIIDPSLLRPNVAMLYDDGENFVSIICSEKQGCDAGMQEMHRLGLIRTPVPPMTFTVTTGMLSRVFYDPRGRITGHEVLDKFGQPVPIPRGTFHVAEEEKRGRRTSWRFEWESDLPNFFRERLPRFSFSEFQAALRQVAKDFSICRALEEMTRIHDYMVGWDTGGKDRGALYYLLSEEVNHVLDGSDGDGDIHRITAENADRLQSPMAGEQILAVDARGFQPEGIDARKVLSCFLDHSHRIGWRRFIVYRAQGQRGIGMGMGAGSTGGTQVDVFGSPGEYCGAFNMGVRLRVHNHAQNFTGMVMHSGILEIHGDVGKVAGYSAKGGTFYILGNVVDRGWVCAVSDPRGPGLEVNIVGTGYEHLGQALMGGSILMLGLYRDAEAIWHRLPSPYQGNKILAGASAGEVIFYDPFGRLEEAQYGGCVVKPIDEKKWKDILGRLMKLEEIFSLGFSRVGDHFVGHMDGGVETIAREHFCWVLPKGVLEGYH